MFDNGCNKVANKVDFLPQSERSFAQSKQRRNRNNIELSAKYYHTIYKVRRVLPAFGRCWMQRSEAIYNSFDTVFHRNYIEIQ